MTDAQSDGPTVTAQLVDGPLEGRSVDTEVLQGRPPSVIEAPADDGTTCRYCLTEWTQQGPVARYSFLYRV